MAESKLRATVAKKSVIAKKTAGAPPVAKASAKTAPKAAAVKTVTKKSVAAKSATHAPAAEKKSVPKTAAGKVAITPEQRYRMICDAAYYKAERRGFVGGNPAEDWVEAEAEIGRLLKKNNSSSQSKH